MVERGLDRDFDLLTMLKPGITERWAFRDRFRLASAPRPCRRDPARRLRSRRSTGSSSRKDVRIIQLWHASGAFKTVGYSRAGKPGDLNPFTRTHKNYTAAIVSSEFDVPFYAEAFGIPEERVVPTGIPRMDRFFDEEARAAGVEAARAAFPEIVGRQTILFAPDIPRRDDPRRLLRLRAPRLRRPPRVVRRARCGGDHQDAPVRAGAAGDPRAVPRPAARRIRCRDRRQRPAVRSRPGHHRLFLDRVRVLDPRPADAVLRLRPRRVRRHAAISTCRSSRSCRAGSCGRSRTSSMRSGARTTRARRSPRSRPATSPTSTAGSTDRVIDELIVAS